MTDVATDVAADKLENIAAHEADQKEHNQKMMEQYNKLLSKLLGECNGNNPQVAVAALISASACVLVDHVDTADRARGYFMHVMNDTLAKFEGAFEQKNTPLDVLIEETGATDVSDDAGERSKEAH